MRNLIIKKILEVQKERSQTSEHDIDKLVEQDLSIYDLKRAWKTLDSHGLLNEVKPPKIASVYEDDCIKGTLVAEFYHQDYLNEFKESHKKDLEEFYIYIREDMQ